LSGEQPVLQVLEVRDAGTVRVHLSGELDLASAPKLAETLRRLREGHEHVVLDLDELEFIDMAGLRVLLTAAEDASRDGWAFTVTRGSPPVRRLIGLVRPAGQLPIDGGSR
jgi:anti-sigma B factor antagonist